MNEFKKFIKAVGTGPKGNIDLSFEESKMAMNMILSGDVPNEMISAFLIGWRLKPETIEEYKGALDAILERSKKEIIPNSIELGFPFDGKAKMPYLFPLTSKFLKKDNINLVVSYDEMVPSKNGVTTKEIIQSAYLEKNIVCFDRKNYMPGLNKLTSLRNNLGLRTALNTLEKVSLAGGSQFGAIGVFHRPYVEKYREIFKDHYQSFLIIQNNEGSPEVIKKGKIWKVTKESIIEEMIDPLEFGIDNNQLIFEEMNLKTNLDLFAEPTPSMISLAKLNAALLLWSISDNRLLRDIINEFDL